MDKTRIPSPDRRAFCLALLGMAGAFAGCQSEAGGGGISEDAKAKEDAERDARLKAYGKSASPATTKKKK